MKLYNRQYAFIIGISKYQNPEYNLKTAEADGRELAKLLESEFTFDAIKTLYNDQANSNAILDQLSWYGEHLGEEDSLFIYYGGHGRVDRGAAFLIPFDGDRHAYNRKNLMIDQINGIFKKVIISRHVFLTVASCFSGEFLMTRSIGDDVSVRDVVRMRIEKPEKYEGRLEKLLSQPTRQVLTAGSNDERMVDNWQESKMSPFCHLFVNGLKENEGAYVEVDELADYVRREMRKVVKSGLVPMPQTPQFADLIYQGKGSFVFQRNKEAIRKEYTDTSKTTNEQQAPLQIKRLEIRGKLIIESYADGELYIDGQCKEKLKSGDGLEMDLRVGEYIIELRSGSKKQTQEVMIKKGEENTIQFISWKKEAKPTKPPEPVKHKMEEKRRLQVFRSEPRKLSKDDVNSMLKKKGFFDTDENKSGKGVKHNYEKKSIQGDEVVLDQASGLMWQRGGSNNWMVYEDAKKWIVDLGHKGYGGYKDWRMPTLEEGMSLMEPSQKHGDLYIDPIFSDAQSFIWTSDLHTAASAAWVVNFCYGYCCYVVLDIDFYVRAVRSGQLS